MATEKAPLKTVQGQPSYRVANRDVEACITRTGGHMGPVTFYRKDRKIQPYSVAPWMKESLPAGTPPLIRVLRGDFFCLPFGANLTPYRGERHPVHGETANAAWAFESLSRSRSETVLHLSLRTRVRTGRVDKRIRLAAEHQAVYVQHRISGMKGPMSFGHHAMLKFPETPGSGLISTSPFVYGQVCPLPAENPAEGGYSILKPHAVFDALDRVPTITGSTADLSRYPLRKGFEDIAMVVADNTLPFAWTAVTFPREGYAWFSLKNPKVLSSTVFWISNGGRHYPPWNGRHTGVLGLEDVTSYFHFGLAESVRSNPVSERGRATTLRLSPNRPLDVNYIMGVVRIPRGFGRVARIEPETEGQAALVDAKGKSVKTLLNTAFLSYA